MMLSEIKVLCIYEAENMHHQVIIACYQLLELVHIPE